MLADALSSLEGWSVASANSGETILEMCERNRARHGATTLEGVAAEVDIVQASPKRRELTEAAIVRMG